MSEAGSRPLPDWRQRLAGALRAQRGSLLLWVPVCLAAGIGGWFSLRFEPDALFYGFCAGAMLAAAVAGLRAGEVSAPLFRAAALVIAGLLLAGARAHLVAEPVLGFRYYGPIEGRIVDIDRSVSDKTRLTLDRVVLKDMRHGRTPTRVRVSLHGDQGFLVPEPGLTVILTGHLSPPNGPVEPGGFDFRRMAWFDGLGAVGYTRTPVLALSPPERAPELAIFRIRMVLSRALQERIPGAAGAFAAALLTGDRSGLPREVVDDLRNSNMAHLLAISGLHMALLTGVVFSALRMAMALVPALALRWPTKKIAAVGALAAAAFYLALSGGAVSTLRAFVMVGVMLVAVLLERRAISLRSVAIAATILLVLSPEALLGPGFQMSFAATTALVVAFGLLRGWRDRLPRPPGWLAPALTVLLSSAVAGAATAPLAAAHFNRIADYGLLANLLSVPLMGALVMPAAVAAVVLWPLGLSGLALWAMRWGLEWILWVAHGVSALDGAVSHVVAPGAGVLPLLGGGFLFLILWQGRARRVGLVPVVAASVLWVQAERPVVLVSDTGGLVGVVGAEGRALSKPRGDGFAARTWLENDGDAADQEQAALRPGFTGAPGDRRIEVAGIRLRHLSGRDAEAQLGRICGNEIVVLSTPPEHRPDGPCILLDPRSLRQSGAVAITPSARGAALLTVADVTGQRLWSPARRRAERKDQ
ncbi:ComEC/Rec2 family competence protein [Tropicimonas sp.]|uniref:ComEC/Rec2 family competence protein n=1 Tax=Tropicimonas sp. TaxID=2067044 RepID=UPI003A854B9D